MCFPLERAASRMVSPSCAVPVHRQCGQRLFCSAKGCSFPVSAFMVTLKSQRKQRRHSSRASCGLRPGPLHPRAGPGLGGQILCVVPAAKAGFAGRLAAVFEPREQLLPALVPRLSRSSILRAACLPQPMALDMFDAPVITSPPA